MVVCYRSNNNNFDSLKKGAVFKEGVLFYITKRVHAELYEMKKGFFLRTILFPPQGHGSLLIQLSILSILFATSTVSTSTGINSNTEIDTVTSAYPKSLKSTVNIHRKKSAKVLAYLNQFKIGSNLVEGPIEE